MNTLSNERHERHRPAEPVCDTELDLVNGGASPQLATTMSNLANMRHEMLKAVANNLRG